MEGIQTKGKDRRTGYTNRGIGLHCVLFVVGLPHFRGGGNVLALGALPPFAPRWLRPGRYDEKYYMDFVGNLLIFPAVKEF